MHQSAKEKLVAQSAASLCSSTYGESIAAFAGIRDNDMDNAFSSAAEKLRSTPRKSFR